MSFGPIMRMNVNGLQIELAPITKEVLREFVSPGMQQHGILKFLSTGVKVHEDEEEWYESVRKDPKSIVWGIWVIDGGTRTVIGSTALHNIERSHMYQATSGSLIFRKEYWGKGIASRIHMARTWYGFHEMGLDRVMSVVVQGNVASLKALQKSGYDLVYVARNTHFADGKLHHQDNLECLNPNDPFWSNWWHGDRPTKRMVEARKRTIAVMQWAEQNVELP